MEGKALVPKSAATILDDEEDDAVLLSLPPPEAQETWYPTLRVTLWVLSCLYTYVDVSSIHRFRNSANDPDGSMR